MVKLAVCSFLLLIPVAVRSTPISQCGSINSGSPAAIKQEVDRIFDRSLDNMESVTSTGVRTSTWISPEQAEMDQVKCLGSAAVPFIAAHLSSERSFGQLLAVRMMGWVGGKEVVPVLSKVLKSSDSQTIKISALESLYSASPADALPIIQQASKSDTNSHVRKKASDMLARYDESK